MFGYNMISKNKKNVTLPSVGGGWGLKNNNITKDPPKSIFTKRKDKISDTNYLLRKLAESDDRISENINYYARGVNPMVSTEYSSIPYKISVQDKFKPNLSNVDAIKGNTRKDWRFSSEQNNEVVSKNITSNIVDEQSGNTVTSESYITPSSVIQSEKYRIHFNGPQSYKVKQGDIEKYKDLKDTKFITKAIGDHIYVEVNTRATKNLQRTAQKPYEVKYFIQDTIKHSANSGKKSMNILQTQEMDVNNNYINDDYRQIHAQTAKGSDATVNNDMMKLTHKQTVHNISEALHSNVVSNKKSNDYKNTYINSVDAQAVKDNQIAHKKVDTYKSKQVGHEHIHKDLELEKTLPSWSSSTNNTIKQEKFIPHENVLKYEQNRPSVKVMSSKKSIGDTTANNGKEVVLQEVLNRGALPPKPTKPRVQMDHYYKLKSDRV